MYIAIEGVIGVGKTTLARLLCPVFEAELMLEIFEENPFLARFYSDRERYAFQTQMFFLLSRYHQQRRGAHELFSSSEHVIADYTFEKDSLFARINLVGDELEMYYRIHEALAEKVQSPDLIVYLRARPDTLMNRIALRDRPYERNMEQSYIEELFQVYEDYYHHHKWGAPVIAIDTDEIDYVRSQAVLEWVANQIRKGLKLSPFQPELPLSFHDEG